MSTSNLAPVQQHIALVGLSGVGKSTVGRRVADRLQMDFVDLDDAIAAAAGKPVTEIFADAGEEAFRDCEAKALADALAADDPVLIATGGGIVLRPENRDVLAVDATVIWLRASTETLVPRISRNDNRPLLAGVDPAEKLDTMVHDRYPLYESVSDQLLDVDDLSLQQAVTCVMELVRWVD